MLRKMFMHKTINSWQLKVSHNFLQYFVIIFFNSLAIGLQHISVRYMVLIGTNFEYFSKSYNALFWLGGMPSSRCSLREV